MAQIAAKYPLENWVDHAVLQILFIAAWFGLDKMLIKKPAAKTYHGAALLIPGYNSGKYQEVLAASIVWARGKGTSRSESPAIFIQKIREWTDYNRQRGKPDPRPYYSYQEWCDEHFPCHNEASLQRIVIALEELGLIVTEQFNSKDLRKRYALDEGAIAALVERWSAAHPEISRKFRGAVKGLGIESSRFGSESSRFNIESPRFDTARHTSSKKAVNQSEIKGSSTQGPEPLALKDKNGFEGTSADSGSHGLSDPLQSTGHESDTSDGEHQDSPIPRSEAPLTQNSGVWKTAYSQLSLLFDRASFDMWLKDATLRNYQRIDGTDVYTVAVKTDHAKEQLQHRYYRKIQRTFEGPGNVPVKINFEVKS